MKKLCLLFFSLVMAASIVFSDDHEEIDFLLFSPNSSDRFENERQAKSQLDSLAKLLLDRKLTDSRICVYGYAAVAANNIDPAVLSLERAVFVVNELQKRGVQKDLFQDPVGYGSVDFWGVNANEQSRIPNRRVRILIDGAVLDTGLLAIVGEPAGETIDETGELEPVIPAADDSKPIDIHENYLNTKQDKFPWLLFLLLLAVLLIAILYMLISGKKKKAAAAVLPEKTPEKKPGPVNHAVPVKEDVSAAAASAIIPAFWSGQNFTAYTNFSMADIEEEIRRRAYLFYLERNGINGNAEGDWFMALTNVGAKYEAMGYQVYPVNGNWWVRRVSKI